MSLASLAMRFVSHQSAKRFEAATCDPARIQQEKILDMVRRNADTEYGRRYGFGSIKTIADYQKQVPIITYEDIKADIDRVVACEKNIFTAEDPVMFAQTSGTTGDPKYIPVTPTCQGREHKDVMRTWMAHALRDHPDIFDAKVVTLVSPAIEGHTSCGLPFGATSGHMYRNMPGLVKRAYAIPYDVFEISDYTAKYYAVMRLALEQDIRFLATANPSSILKLCEKADEFSEEFIRDLRDGTLSEKIDVETRIRQSLKRLLKPNAAAAQRLEEARRRRDGRLIPADYWPRLSLIGCWKGGTVGHYLDTFPEWFDPEGRRPVPVRDWGFLSSEARCSVPLSDEGSQGVLTVASNFFEFVPVEDLEAKPDSPESWNILTVGELEQEKDYYILITTTGGLYRYDINDVIRVTGRYNQTPQIVFQRKGRGMTNLTGEKVSVNQVITAVQEAARETGTTPEHFRAEADEEASRYLLRVEFTTRTSPETARKFLEAFDRQLKEINIEYKAKRDSLRLGNPVLHLMREGWYERAHKQQVENGMRAFQVKTQLLAPLPEDTAKIRPELEAVVELTGAVQPGPPSHGRGGEQADPGEHARSPGQDEGAGTAPAKDSENSARAQSQGGTRRELDQEPVAYPKNRTAGRRGLLWAVMATILLVSAVGAWRLLTEYDFGVATELSRVEALQALWPIRLVLWGLLALLATLLLALAISFRIIKQLRRHIVQLGQYTLVEKLSEGPMCTVYLARHAMLRRPTVIKLFKGDQTDTEGLARFEKEVHLTSELTHPNTVTVYDYGRTPDGVFYYAMEYLPGIDLEQLVRLEKSVPPARVVHILRQVCASLAEAHGRGLIHRDIKPQNIILCERGGIPDFVKVLDFGLVQKAKRPDPAETSGQGIFGSPGYIAPERLTTPERTDARADIYSLGAVAFFLLTGDIPFPGTSNAEICTKVVHDPPPRPSEHSPIPIPVALDELVLACLAKNLDDRPSSTEEVATRLASMDFANEWSASQARRWWQENLQKIRSLGLEVQPSALIGAQTLDIDWRRRQSVR